MTLRCVRSGNPTDVSVFAEHSDGAAVTTDIKWGRKVSCQSRMASMPSTGLRKRTASVIVFGAELLGNGEEA